MITSIVNLFTNSRFQIPKYQRSYAWDEEQVRDLVTDLLEAVELNTPHYIGTIVVAKDKTKKNTFNIVDGQQRTTTLTIFLNELIRRLPDASEQTFNRMMFIKDSEYKLIPLHADRQFFHDMLEGLTVTPVSNSQRRLLRSKEIINDVLDTAPDHAGLLAAIKELQLMQFVQENDGEAIRIFQTVNDRGKALSNMEKAKSLLIYYSNRFLEGRLDDQVNDCFGQIFREYDTIKELAGNLQITILANKIFDEDNIMRYHFIGFSDYDYDATPKVVLDYLKNRLKELKDDSQKDKELKGLAEFIDSYVKGLGAYFATLATLVKRADTDVEYFKFFSVLGPNTNLYPLLIALGERNWLDQPIDPVNNVTLLRLLALVDIRVYKIRGTEPKADISRFTFEVYHDKISFAQCVQWLKDYLERWMGDSLLKANLSGNVYDNFRAMLPFTLLEQNEALDAPFDLATLKTIVLGKQSSLTVEHILAQHPTFSATAYGFADEEEFAFYQHHLGNLSIIEKSVNSAANNKSPTEKVTYYDGSLFRACKAIGTTIGINRKFHKDDIDVRTAKLLEFYLDRYCLK